MKPVFSNITLYVSNVWFTVEWYRKVFGLVPTLLNPAGHDNQLHAEGMQLVIVAAAQAQLLIPRFQSNSFLFDPPGLHLTFATVDVEALYQAALAHGGVGVAEPAPNENGLLQAGLRDINGVLISLVTKP